MPLVGLRDADNMLPERPVDPLKKSSAQNTAHRVLVPGRPLAGDDQDHVIFPGSGKTDKSAQAGISLVLCHSMQVQGGLNVAAAPTDVPNEARVASVQRWRRRGTAVGPCLHPLPAPACSKLRHRGFLRRN